MARTNKNAPVAFVLNVEEVATLGKEAATLAASSVVQAGNVWNRIRSLYVPAQEAGQSNEFVTALFEAGDKVKGKKAPWYRAYKSILSRAAKDGVTVTSAMSAKQAQDAVRDAADATETAEEKKAKALAFFGRMWASAIANGLTEAELIGAGRKAIKDAASKKAAEAKAALAAPAVKKAA